MEYVLPDEKLGAGLTVQEYAHIAELTGRSLLAPTVLTVMHQIREIWRCYGVMAVNSKTTMVRAFIGRKNSLSFCMTEPDVASSDATNMQATALIDGNEIVLNGKKWWSSGLGDPNAKVIILWPILQMKLKTAIINTLWF